MWAQRHVRRLYKHLGRQPPGDCYPLFCGPNGQATPKQAAIELFRRVIQQTGTNLTRPDPSGEVCRVSGRPVPDPPTTKKQFSSLADGAPRRSHATYSNPTSSLRPAKGCANKLRTSSQATDYPLTQYLLGQKHRLQQGTPAGHRRRLHQLSHVDHPMRLEICDWPRSGPSQRPTCALQGRSTSGHRCFV